MSTPTLSTALAVDPTPRRAATTLSLAVIADRLELQASTVELAASQRLDSWVAAGGTYGAQPPIESLRYAEDMADAAALREEAAYLLEADARMAAALHRLEQLHERVAAMEQAGHGQHYGEAVRS